MTDKEKIITDLREALDSLDITSSLRLVLIHAIEYLQKEPVSDDLEEEIERFLDEDENIPSYSKTARHFAEWQKQQMTKDAVDATVYKGIFNKYVKEQDEGALIKVLANFEDCDKVKIIIVKED